MNQIIKVLSITIGVLAALVITFICVGLYDKKCTEERNRILFSQVTHQDETNVSPKDTMFVVNGVEFKMIGIPGGTIKLKGAKDTIAVKTFYLAETEVTQELWNTVMNNNPSKFKGDKLPVEGLTSIDCCDFVSKLDSITGYDFYIPSYYEWSYAGCIGMTPIDSIKQTGVKLGDLAWYVANSKRKTHPVKMKLPNKLGLYDMLGNVDEWITVDLKNLDGSTGGSWKDTASCCNIEPFTIRSSEFDIDTKGLRLAWNGRRSTSKKN